MRLHLINIFRLGIKELYSLRRDPVMVFLIVYAFSYAVYSVATGAGIEVRNAAVAVVDEDRSLLSRRITDAFLPPYFRPAAELEINDIDEVLDKGRHTFVLDIPPDFQADVVAGKRPALQLNIDATAMSQAGIGAGYVNAIVDREVATFLALEPADPAAKLVVRSKFNTNLVSVWFDSVMEVINNITLLAIILTGAALIREREHGTIEHLLVMPLRPFEIMSAKVWANGLVVVIAATLSLLIVVQGILDVRIAGSIPLFVAGTAVYLFSVTSLGILLATLARSMPQFGLLAILVFIVMNLLSGGRTPLDSMPYLVQIIMQISPSTHFVSFAQAVLFRGADLAIVWQSLLAMVIIGFVYFGVALLRFRRAISMTRA